MKIKIGQIFRYQSGSVASASNYEDYYALTKGVYNTGVGTGGKGIFPYAKVSEPDKDFPRIPAFIIHSNPFKEGTEQSPWVDIINADQGYAVYNGDNKSSKLTACESSGNKALINTFPLYRDHSKRIFAPPIIIFKQEIINGKRKGYRSFQGYGIPTKAFSRIQREKNSPDYFTNLVFEILLLNLDTEDDKFSWEWIDKRRDKHLTSKETLKYAPKAWRDWVKKRDENFETLRRTVSKRLIISENEQKDIPPKEKKILEEVNNFFGIGKKKSKHHFEGLASAVSCRVIGSGIKQGWITPKSRDEGIDFVNRLDLGDGSSKTSIVVLGQAKCIKTDGSISASDLARVVARLQRGWIGVYVTTGVFSKKAQKELKDDNYPMILINGKRLAQEIIQMKNIENISPKELFEKHSSWYENHIQPMPPYRIIDWDFPQEVV
jgi:hypothetical protein|tara:strand:+ start:286 stop:1590 length:1305 start_codon:yes stop_codon:yes gene_type:complete